MKLLSFVLLSFSLASVTSAAPKKNSRKQSFIQLVSDGFGPASETFARSFVQGRDSLAWTAELPLDKHLVGTIRTRSTDSLVTDSAASATAYSCGMKSVNAYIGVDSEKKPCGTTLEAAKAKGYKTGLVSTSRITHATPASWSAHVDDRDAEDEIASQQLGNYMLGRQVDLLWGCGLRQFLPNTTELGIRTDGRDLIAEAKEADWTFLTTREDFDSTSNGTKVTFPSLALWESSPSHCAYELDRKPEEEPSLTEMALAALTALDSQEEPFYIMIEGARIDHAAHNNDPVGHVYDILEYNKMVEAVTGWMDSKKKADEPEVILISTSDHECGGLTLGAGGEYLWYPDVLLNATHTTEYLAAQFASFNESEPVPTDEAKRAYIVDEVISKGLGISDVTDAEIEATMASTEDELALTIFLGTLLNTRAHLGWSTTGHSGIDVNLYYYESPSKSNKHKEERKREFVGNHENTFVGTWTADYLDLDLESITRTLNNGSNYSWANDWSDKLSTFTDNLEHYHGGKASAGPAKREENKRYGYTNTENVEILKRMSEKSHAQSKRTEL